MKYTATLATFDEHGLYRFTLERRWGPGPTAIWFGLNPSRADAELDDATIRKEVGFSDRWGMGELVKVNLGAYISTDPAKIDTTCWVGSENDRAIGRVLGRARPGDLVVAAWGELPRWAERRGFAVLDMLRGFDVVCVGKTRKGAPMHPSRAPYVAAPLLYRAKAAA